MLRCWRCRGLPAWSAHRSIGVLVFGVFVLAAGVVVGGASRVSAAGFSVVDVVGMAALRATAGPVGVTVRAGAFSVPVE